MQTKKHFSNKLWTFIAGVGSAAVMILAFLIPSLQDQWDRYQSRKVIEKYEDLGNDFFKEEKYELAEKAYEKAYELSENKRLDIEVKRLNARVNRIGYNPIWGAKPPEEIEDIDFQFLLKMIPDQNKSDKVAILNSYGVYLAGLKKIIEAKKTFDKAIQLDSSEAITYTNLGNLFDQMKQKEKAEKYYLKSIKLDPNNAGTHYNLGLLYMEQEKFLEAKKELEKALKNDPSDVDVIIQLKYIQDQLNKKE